MTLNGANPLAITDGWCMVNYGAFDRICGDEPLEITTTMELTSKQDMGGLTTLRIFNENTTPTTIRVDGSGGYSVRLSNGQYFILYKEFESLLPKRTREITM